MSAAAGGTDAIRGTAGRGPLLAGGAVVLAFAAVAAAYAILVPLGQPPDEPSHLGYAHLVADHRALPSATVPEKQQPPLYYLAAAALLRVGVPDQGLRALSVVLGAAAVAAVMLAATALRPGHPWEAVAAGAVVAVLPFVQAGGGAVSNDPLAWLCGALLVLLLVRVCREPAPAPRVALAAGVTIGLALLSKETAWVLCALLAAVLLWRWRGRWTAGPAAAAAVPPMLIAGWWFARNLVEFHRPTPPLGPLTPQDQYLRSPGQLRGFVSETVRSVAGPQTTLGLVPRASWATAATWVLVAGLGVLTVAACARLLARREALPAGERAALVGAGLAGVLVAVAYVLNSVLVDLQPQARYLAVAAATGATAWAAAGARWLRGGAGPLVARLSLAAIPVVAVLVAALDVDSLRVAAGR